MVTYPTLRRLSSARNLASEIGLPQTSERIEILRMRLAEYKDIPEGLRDKRLRWARGKLEDTVRTLEKEEASLDEDTKRAHEWRGRDQAMLAKGAGFLASVWGTIKALDSFPDNRFLVIAGAIMGFTVLCSVIDRIIGPVSFEKGKEMIIRTLEGCRRELLAKDEVQVRKAEKPGKGDSWPASPGSESDHLL